MQAVHGPLARDGPARRHKGLPSHVTAEHPLEAFVGAAAAEDVHLDRLKVEDFQQPFQRR